jgi:ribonuclease J
MGIPDKDRRGGSIPDLVAETVGEVLDSLPKARRRDPEAVEDSVARAVRSALRNVWGKKPACHVLVVEV